MKDAQIPALPSLLNTPTPRPIFGEIFEHDVADIDDPSQSLLYRWCVQSDWKLIVSAKGKPPELFRIVADPHEQTNVAEQHPHKVRELTKLLDEWWTPEKSPPRTLRQ